MSWFISWYHRFIFAWVGFLAFLEDRDQLDIHGYDRLTMCSLSFTKSRTNETTKELNRVHTLIVLGFGRST